ncbi:MAG: AsmA-like C-terminal region-containing protein [Candidatus Binatia bacterium]|nr:AsmA-like C-terminal region-containing protein [Candidatus Binatia bacterium]
MRRFGLILLVLLVVLGGVLGLALLNVNRYLNENRDWIEERTESATGRRISFGEIGLSLWGGFGARVSDLQVADDPAFSDEPFLRAGVARVKVAILPALFGRVEVQEIVLEDPTVRVIRDLSGMNFETLGAPGPAEPAASGPPSSEGDENESAPLGIALLIGLVTIRDGEVVYVDRTVSPATSTALQHLDVSAIGVGSDDPVEVSFAAAVLGADEPNVRIDGQVGPLTSATAKNVGAVSLDLAVRIGPVVLDEMRGLPGAGEAMPPELSAPDPLTLVARIQGSPSRLGFEVDLDATAARLGYGDAFHKGAGVPLTLAVSGTQSSEQIDLTKLELVLAKLELGGSGTVKLGPDAKIDVRIDADGAPLAGWNEILPALKGYDLAGTVSVHLSVAGKVDGTTPPAVTGTVALAEVSGQQEGSTDEIEGLSTKLEFTGKATRFKGDVRIDRGSLGNVPFDTFGAELAMADDVASLQKIEMNLLGGSYEGKGKYDLRDAEAPRFDFSQELRGVDVSRMLASQSPSAGGRMTGRLSGKLQVAGSGSGAEAVHKTLRGDGSVVVTDGVLVGVNLAELVLESLTGISGLTGLLSDDLRTKYADLFSADDTTFERMSASVLIEDGRARTDDAIVAARDYTLRGEGSVAFDGELDFTTTLVASEELTGDVIRSVREARYITNDEQRVAVRARIVGVLPDVSVKPDAEFVAKALTKGAIGAGLELLGGGKKKDASGTKPGALAADSEAEPKRPEDVGAELIEKGLRGLFGD